MLAADSRDYDRRYALPASAQLALADRWILSRLQTVQTEATRLIEGWQLGEAGRQLYEFMWNEYCDWYIEAAKVRLNGGNAEEAQATRQVLLFVLEQSLRLLHPYLPFVTETIWQNLPELGGDNRALIAMQWPQLDGNADAAADDAFGRLQEIVRGIRNARAEYDVEPARRIAAQISAGDQVTVLQQNQPLLLTLARLDGNALQIAPDLPAPDKAITLAVGGVTVYLPLAGLVDLAAERSRLQKEIEGLDGQLRKIDGLLNNPGFVNKAAANVVERERTRQRELQEKHAQLTERLASLVG